MINSIIAILEAQANKSPPIKVAEHKKLIRSQNQSLYLNILSVNKDDLNILIEVFKELRDVGLNNNECIDVCISIFQEAHCGKQLLQLFNLLKEVNFSGKALHDAYINIIIEGIIDLDGLIKGINILKKAGFTYNAHPDAYLTVIDNPFHTYMLSEAFNSLTKAGITSEDRPDMYLNIVDNMYDAGLMPDGFDFLRKAGLTGKANQEIYLTIIKNPYYSTMLHLIFKIIKNAGFTTQKHPALYRAAINANCEPGLLAETFSLQKNAGFNGHDHPAIYQAACHDPYLYKPIAIQLSKIGFSPKIHSKIYKKMDEYIFSATNLTNASLFLNLISEYAKKEPENFEEHELLKIIEELTSHCRHGPLNKTLATREFQNIIKMIANNAENYKTINMTFDEKTGYTISIPNRKKVNLTILLQYANLSHFVLNNTEIENLGTIIEHLTSKDPHIDPGLLEKKHSALNRLSQASREAIYYYISERYQNINRLFRGEKLLEQAVYQWLTPTYSRENLLVNFLCGCLVNDAANKLPGLLWNMPNEMLSSVYEYQKNHTKSEFIDLISNKNKLKNLMKERIADKKILDKSLDNIESLDIDDLSFLFNKKPVMLDRGEMVPPELKKRRLANILQTPSITSFSLFNQGVNHFHTENTTRTSIKLDASHLPVISWREGEIILPHGEQIKYQDNHEGGFFACIVRSPDYVKSETYLSALALQYAYDEHLNKPYKDDPENHVIINTNKILRPNHGLAHTYRVMKNISHVLNYYSQHANDDGFKNFCRKILPEECEWLRVAAVFSITGRESEVSFRENSKLYDTYRKASKDHLEKFLNDHLPEYVKINTIMKERILSIVRHMGNPNYEDGVSSSNNASIQDAKNSNEKLHRDYMHRLLNIAHKLDLPRCYNAIEFEKSTEVCRDLSSEILDTPEDYQRSDYLQLIRQSIALIRAHGDSIMFDIDQYGSHTRTQRSYAPPFEEVSQSIKRLIEISETVPLGTVPFYTNDFKPK